MAISVIVADREQAFADALAARLRAEEDIDAAAAVEVSEVRPSLRAGLAADVLLLDGDLPGEGANRLCSQLAAEAGSALVVTLSFSSEPERIVAAVRAGSAGWVRKDESLEYLLRVIRGVSRGESWLPPAETGNVLRLLMEADERQRDDEHRLALLTRREREVLVRLAEAAGDRRAVARQLHLSVNTVRTHLQNTLAKLGVHSTLEAIALVRDDASVVPRRPVHK